MRLLLDTHILLWAASSSPRLPRAALALLSNPTNTVYFSIASLWEITIKHGLGRRDFDLEPVRFHRDLVDSVYLELQITAAHALGINLLPRLHEDPFDRLLLAQADAEGLTLLTNDATLAQYPGLQRAHRPTPRKPP